MKRIYNYKKLLYYFSNVILSNSKNEKKKKIMAITRLQRREKRIKERLVSRQKFLKDILRKPVIKRITTQEIIESFNKK